MKLFSRIIGSFEIIPAAFRRLCVETGISFWKRERVLPAAFRRLCVETEFVFYNAAR